MAEDRDRSVRDHREFLNVHCEPVHLNPIDLVAGKGAREGIDRDILWLNVAMYELSFMCERKRGENSTAEFLVKITPTI